MKPVRISITIILYFILGITNTAVANIASSSIAETQLHSLEEMQILLVSDQTATISQEISANLKQALKDASIKTVEISSDALVDYTAKELASFSAVILSSETSPQNLFFEDAKNYIQNGGCIFFGVHSWFKGWIEDLGIKSRKPEPKWIDAKGVKSLTPIFKDVSIKISPENFSNSMMELEFTASWTTHITSLEPIEPLLLTRNFGKGSVIFFNGSCLSEKVFRGIFLFALLRQLPIAAMSVFNATLIHLDDSPPPAYGLREGPVGQDLGLTDEEFHRKIWPGEVLTMLDDNHLPVTHFPTFRYDGKIKAPFPIKSDREPFFTDVLTALQERGDDFGLHGYNHQSLTMGKSPSKPWQSFEDMLQQSKAAHKAWDHYKLPPTLVYVPPNNVISKNGKLALAEGFPSIRVICRVYNDSGKFSKRTPFGYLVGNKNSKHNLKIMKNIFRMYAQRSSMVSNNPKNANHGDEFGIDQDVPKFLNLPRISSGHFLDEYEKLEIMNGIMAHGIIVHFFHPDDIYDPARRRKSWEYTLTALRRVILFFNRIFGYSRKITTSKFLKIFKKYVFGTATLKSDKKSQLQIEKTGRDYFYLFSKNYCSAPQITGGELEKTIEPGHLFLIRVDSPKATVSLNH
jgi:hypothetical protein